MIIAKAIAGRIALNSAPFHSRNQPPPGEQDKGFSPSRAQPASAAACSAPVFSSDQSPQVPESVNATDAQPINDSIDTNDTALQEHFQRGLGAYPLRNRSPTALLTVHDTGRPIGTTRNTGCAMLASSSAADPKTRKQAVRDDRSGWTAAERAEIANHTENGSWELIDRSAVPPGRALVRLIWVYKRKRNGTLKARLC
eukprot:604620-Pleurochrysis_carterae.AAC.1